MPLYIYTDIHSDFTPNAVQPIECLKAGWELIKDQYWLFMGVTLVALLIGQLAPFGILMAPMMCGIYLVLFQRLLGRQVEFATLFRGFEFFGESIIALLCHLIPVMILVVPFVVLIFLGSIVMPSDSSGEGFAGGFLILLLALVLIALMLAITVLFIFAYPLIVDRRLSGLEAVKLSVKAAGANFWGLLGLILLNGLWTFVGLLCCYVGALFVMPVTFAAIACAYQQVFGLTPVESLYPPPPPNSFA